MLVGSTWCILCCKNCLGSWIVPHKLPYLPIKRTGHGYKKWTLNPVQFGWSLYHLRLSTIALYPKNFIELHWKLTEIWPWNFKSWGGGAFIQAGLFIRQNMVWRVLNSLYLLQILHCISNVKSAMNADNWNSCLSYTRHGMSWADILSKEWYRVTSCYQLSWLAQTDELWKRQLYGTSCGLPK